MKTKIVFSAETGPLGDVFWHATITDENRRELMTTGVQKAATLMQAINLFHTRVYRWDRSINRPDAQEQIQEQGHG